MAKKNSKSGGNTPHIKGDELVQEVTQQLVNLITDVADLNDDDIKPIEKYKRGEDIVMSAYANEIVQATLGTPFSKGNDAQNTLNCVRQMQISMRDWEKERKERKLPIVKHRVGVHFGDVLLEMWGVLTG